MRIKERDIFGPLAWVALLASPLVFYGVRLPATDHFVNLSLFDPVAVVVFAATMLYCGVRRQPVRFVATAIATLLAVAGHAVVISLTHDPAPDSAWLLRGTVKLGTIVFLFTILALVFRSEVLGPPPVHGVRTVFAICVLSGLLWNHFDLPFTPNTLLTANNWLFYFLVLLGQDWPFSTARLAANLFIAAALAVISLILLSKTGAIIGCLVFAALVFVHLREHRETNTLFAALALGVLGAAAVAFLMGQTELLQRIDSLARSVSVRLALWSLAWNGIAATFPLGTGIEQFVTLVVQDPVLAKQNHKFPHSLPIGLVTELGLLGFALVTLAALLFWRAAQGVPAHLRPVFFAIILPLILLHDIQGARLLLLVSAFGYARWSIRESIATAKGAMNSGKI